jgi:hypothetical protein
MLGMLGEAEESLTRISRNGLPKYRFRNAVIKVNGREIAIRFLFRRDRVCKPE